MDVRIETVLSKYPVHNLAKKGNVTIQIVHKNGGQVDFLWKVSPSRDYGEPRQLAYKLDMLIKRHIEHQEGSSIIKLGSLDQLCRELGFARNGKNVKNLKRAFYQNAFAAITAKMKYTANDGSEQSFEAGFTRYSVVFTGEKLSNGKKADAVFIALNPHYQKILKTARARPLDYDYLKNLPPAAGRFYELISYLIFAALRHPNTYPKAKLSYSDYCIRSPQHRYYELWKVKRQMTPILRSHLESGYLKNVQYEETQDSENNPDWTMIFTLGPKAKDEFNRKKRSTKSEIEIAEERKVDDPRIIAREASARELDAGDRLDQVKSSAIVSIAAAIDAPKNESAQKNLPLTWNPMDLVQHFHKTFLGIENYQPYSGSKEIPQAKKLLSDHGADLAQFIVDFAIQEARRQNYAMRTFGAVLPFASSAIQAYNQRQNERERIAEIERKQEEKRRREENDCQLGFAPLKNLSETEYQERYQKVRNKLLESWPWFKDQPTNETFENSIRMEMLSQLEKENE